MFALPACDQKFSLGLSAYSSVKQEGCTRRQALKNPVACRVFIRFPIFVGFYADFAQ
jgi:hypothetical protein